jgi:hypothetical protein
MRSRIGVAAFAVLTLVYASLGAQAEVTRIEIASRADVLDGKSFGSAGAYQKLIGRVFFAVDPNHPRNKAIVDLDKAPRDAAGRVEFSADLYVLAPACNSYTTRRSLASYVGCPIARSACDLIAGGNCPGHFPSAVRRRHRQQRCLALESRTRFHAPLDEPLTRPSSPPGLATPNQDARNRSCVRHRGTRRPRRVTSR